MSFLIRFEAVTDDGEVLQDESMICEMPALEIIEKRVSVIGGGITMRFTFDPPLRVLVSHPPTGE